MVWGESWVKRRIMGAYSWVRGHMVREGVGLRDA